MTRPNQLPLDGANCSASIWAPALRYYNGMFYMVTSIMSHGGNFFVTTTDPAGLWFEPVWFDPDGWDPSLFFDDDGTVYLTRSGSDSSGKTGIVQYTLDVQTGVRTSEPRLVWDGAVVFGAEGPHLYKINGYYYLLIAAGATHGGHLAAGARGRSPWGPWESCPHNPILSHRDHLERRIQATGHADFVQAYDGSWWLVCLGLRSFHGLVHPLHHIGRETFLAPVQWTDDNWPVVNGNGTISSDGETTLAAHPWPSPAVRDDFDAPVLHHCWNFVRNPLHKNYTLTHRPGWLGVRCSAATLDECVSPAFLGRRQTLYDSRFATMIDFVPQLPDDGAGLAVLTATMYHYDFAIRQTGGQRELVLRRRIDDVDVIVVQQVIPDGLVQFVIESNAWAYLFSYAVGNDDLTLFAKAQAKHLPAELVGGFTGVYLGLFATGNGSASSTTAWYTWVDYGQSTSV